MGSGIFFPLCALPFNILVLVLFFIKGYIKNEETRIYVIMLLSNFFGLIIEIGCTFASMIYDSYPLVSDFIYKSYLVYLVVWIGLFLSYVHSISFKKQNLKMKRIFRLLLFIEIIIIYLLPIDLILKDNFSTRYTTGLSVNFTYLISSIDILIILIFMFKNYKEIKSKKYLPILIFLIIGTFAITIQLIYPHMLKHLYY